MAEPATLQQALWRMEKRGHPSLYPRPNNHLGTIGAGVLDLRGKLR